MCVAQVWSRHAVLPLCDPESEVQCCDHWRASASSPSWHPHHPDSQQPEFMMHTDWSSAASVAFFQLVDSLNAVASSQAAPSVGKTCRCPCACSETVWKCHKELYTRTCLAIRSYTANLLVLEFAAAATFAYPRMGCQCHCLQTAAGNITRGLSTWALLQFSHKLDC